jgi:hypothetical protein
MIAFWRQVRITGKCCCNKAHDCDSRATFRSPLEATLNCLLIRPPSEEGRDAFSAERGPLPSGLAMARVGENAAKCPLRGLRRGKERSSVSVAESPLGPKEAPPALFQQTWLPTLSDGSVVATLQKIAEGIGTSSPAMKFCLNDD